MICYSFVVVFVVVVVVVGGGGGKGGWKVGESGLSKFKGAVHLINLKILDKLVKTL